MNIHERIDEIIADYERGHSTHHIAAKQKITIDAVRGILRMSGVRMRGRGRVTDFMRDQFRMEYEAGATTTKIGAKYDLSQTSVYKHLCKVGVVFRNVGRRKGPRPKTCARVPEAFKLRTQGKTWREVADEAGFNTWQAAYMACSRHPELSPT